MKGVIQPPDEFLRELVVFYMMDKACQEIDQKTFELDEIVMFRGNPVTEKVSDVV